MIYFFFPYDSRIGGVQDVILRWNAILKEDGRELKVIDYSVKGWTVSLSEIESIPLNSLQKWRTSKFIASSAEISEIF